MAEQSVSFFTKYTQTFFEPYVETFVNDRIDDNRQNFAAGVFNNLYLYVTKGTNFYDLDTMPRVDILDSTGSVITGLGNIQLVKCNVCVILLRLATDKSPVVNLLINSVKSTLNINLEKPPP